MSKDKGGKNVKKAPGAESKKGQSSYQMGKKSTSSDTNGPIRKK